MDMRNIFDAGGSLGTSGQRQDITFELQELRKRRCYLAAKLNTFALEFVRFQSEFTDIQKREEELLGKLLQHPSPHEAPLTQSEVEQQPPTSLATGGSFVMPFDSSQLQQLLGSVSGGKFEAASDHGHGMRNDDGHQVPKTEPIDWSVLSEIQATSSSCTTGAGTGKRSAVGASSEAKKKKLNEISFEQLREHVANIANLCDETTGEFKCPVCARTKKESKFNSIRHLQEHLGDKAYYPYKCPVENCDTTSMRHDNVRAHVVNVHKLEWSVELKSSSTDTEKKAVIESLAKACN
ncbi:hypothetical protein AAVH_08931 [Aphelenchoides avenae]|nr:hypothetical protein AAVH_08931 [Aphelenchus avenae]